VFSRFFRFDFAVRFKMADDPSAVTWSENGVRMAPDQVAFYLGKLALLIKHVFKTRRVNIKGHGLSAVTTVSSFNNGSSVQLNFTSLFVI